MIIPKWTVLTSNSLSAMHRDFSVFLLLFFLFGDSDWQFVIVEGSQNTQEAMVMKDTVAVNVI